MFLIAGTSGRASRGLAFAAIARAVTATLLVTLMLAATAPVRAGVSADAGRFIEQLAHDTVSVVADQTMDPVERDARLRALLNRGFDTEVISRFVLGRYWRVATPAQQQAFVTLFRDYVTASYAHRLQNYAGQTLQVVAAREQRSQDGTVKALVVSRLVQPGGEPVQVNWRVQRSESGWRIYDVLVEGVSMVLTQRDEIAAVILRGAGNIDTLLKHMQDTIARLGTTTAGRGTS